MQVKHCKNLSIFFLILTLSVSTLGSFFIFSVSALDESIIVHDISSSNLVISDNATYSVSGTTTQYNITVSTGCSPKVILNGVSIDVSATSGKGAFVIAENSTGNVIVEIADSTTNSLKSGQNRAGIDKSSSLGSAVNMVGTLTINGGLATSENTGTLYAQGGLNAAGIGGGSQKSAGEIIINGGKLTTRSNGLQYNVGSGCASSIGGGGGSALTQKYARVTINGGYIDATTGSYSAVIGTGDWNAGGCAYVTLNGGYIYVNNQNESTASYYAIGGGYDSSAVVTITGGTLYNMNTNANYFIGAASTLTKNIDGGSFNADVTSLIDTSQYKCLYSSSSELYTVLPNSYYSVTCFLDGNYYESYALESGSLLNTLPQPNMTGYAFDGWYSESGLVNKVSTMPNENITVYAQMLEKQVKLNDATDKNGFNYKYGNSSVIGGTLTILSISVDSGYFTVNNSTVAGSTGYTALSTTGAYSIALNTSTQYKTITLHGTFNAIDLQAFLRGITFTMQAGVVQNTSVSLCSNELNDNMGVLVDSEGVTHYYEFISGTKSWKDSYNEAKTKTYNGLTGYLATITSKLEHDYIYNVVDGASGWIGGMRVASNYTGAFDTTTAAYTEGGSNVSTNQYWYWTNGPEAGKRFFTQNSYGGGGANYILDGINYSNWNNGEPNAANGLECYAQYGFSTTKLWNDLSSTNYTTNIVGYYIEYSAYSYNDVDNVEIDAPSTDTASYGEAIITFNANGGTVSPATKTVVLGNTYGQLPTPIKAGHSFNGWFTAIDGGAQILTATQLPSTDDHTLYAHWTLNQPTITNSNHYSEVYDSNNHTISVSANSSANVTYTYQWYKNEVLIDGANTASYTVKDVADSGIYTCNVTINDGTQTASKTSAGINVVITKVNITLTADTNSKTYDGASLSDSGYTISGTLATGESESVVITSSITNVGSISNVFDAITIYDGLIDVTANYNITTVSGTLAVTKREVTFKADDVEVIYNGTSHTGDTVSITSGSLASGQSINTLTFINNDINAGDYTLTINSITIKDAGNNDVTSNYNITYLSGSLKINRKNITVASSDSPTVSKIYDGTTNGISFVSTDDYNFVGLVSGESLALNFTAVYNDKDVLDANKVTLSGLSIGDATGLASNYTLLTTTFDIAASITPATLTNIAMNDDPTMVYSGTRYGVTTNLGYIGAIGTEIPVIRANLTYTGSSAGDGKTVTVDNYVITWSGISTEQAAINSNYQLALTAPEVLNTGIITPKLITESDITANLVSSLYTYTGNPITPSAIISSGAKTLVKYTDYTLEYLNNINVGNATVTVIGQGNYLGTFDLNFTIQQLDLSSTANILVLGSYTYNGTQICPLTFIVNGNNKVLKEYEDFLVTYGANVNAGTGSITFTFTGNYSGSKEQTFIINKADISPTVSLSGWTFNETPNIPSVTGNSGGGLVTYYFKLKNADDNTYTTVLPINAGIYTIKAEIEVSQNYNEAVVLNEFTISKADFTPMVSINGWIYGQTANAPQISGNTSSGSIVYYYKVSGSTDDTYTTTVPSNGGNYTIKAIVTETSNYNSVYAISNFTISKAQLTVTADNKTVTYSNNSPVYTVTFAGFVNSENNSVLGGNLLFNCAYSAGSYIGAYDIIPYGLTSNNYEFTYVTGTLTVNKVQVVMPVITNLGLVYNGTLQTPGIISNSTYSILNNQGTNAGLYTAVVTLNDPFNYEWTNGTTNSIILDWSIAPFIVNVNWSNNSSYVYNGFDQADTISAWYQTIFGFRIDLNVSFSGQATEFINRGNYTATASMATLDTNYILTNTSKAFTVEKRNLTITANSDSKTYDGTALTDNGYSITSGSFVAGEGFDTVTVAGSQLYVGSSNNVITGYTLSGTTNADNYNITLANGILTINKAAIAITITADSNSKTYDGQALTDGGYTLVGSLATGDSETVVVTGTITNFGIVDNNITTVTIYHNGVDVTENYVITKVKGSLTINKRNLTITANSGSKTYDGTALTDNGYSITSGSFVAGEGFDTVTVAGSQLYVGSSNNVITGYTLSGTTNADNYNITLANGILTINKAAIAITITADSNSKTYDGQALTDGGYTLVGSLATGDSETVVVTGTITNFGIVDNNITTVTIYHNGVDVTENYVITKVKGSLTINKRNLTITANSGSKTYDGTALTDNGYSITSGSFVAGEGFDTVTVAGSQLYVGSSNNVITGYTLSGTTNADNYNITLANGILTINKAAIAITITADSNSKTYDGQALTDGGYTLVGSLATGDSETVVVTGTITNFGIVDNNITTVTIYHNGVDVTENYVITKVKGSLTINKRNLTITANSGSKTYDGTALTDNGYSITSGSFVAGEGFDTVTVAGSQLYVGSSNNVITGYTLSGTTNADNYNITLANGTLTINKAAIAITITADSNSKTYDGQALTDGGYTLVGSLATGDSETVVVTGTITNFGIVDNNITTVTIYHNGVDVTENYVITKVKGSLTINKRNLTITANSGSKTYDGTALTDNGYSITSGSFVAGEGFDTVTVAGSQSDAGTSDNTISTYTFTDTTNSDNYNVTTVKGTLTVGQAQSSISDISDISRVSNGTPVAAPTYTIIGDGEVTIEYYSGDSLLQFAPTTAGTYTVKINIADGKNYIGTSATKEFTITKIPTQTKIESDEGVPAVETDNFDNLFDEPVTDSTKGVTQEEIDNASDIVVTFIAKDIEVTTPDEDLLKNNIVGKDIGLLVDLSIVKKVTYPNGDVLETNITETNDVVKVIIPIPDALKDKEDLVVYRVHEGVITTFNTTPDENGEYFEIDGDNIIIYSKFFSTYAVAYNAETTPPTGENTNFVMYITIMLASANIIAYTIYSKKRRA